MKPSYKTLSVCLECMLDGIVLTNECDMTRKSGKLVPTSLLSDIYKSQAGEKEKDSALDSFSVRPNLSGLCPPLLLHKRFCFLFNIDR